MKFPEGTVVFPDILINVELFNDQKEAVGAAVKVWQDIDVLVDNSSAAELKGLQQLWNKL